MWGPSGVTEAGRRLRLWQAESAWHRRGRAERLGQGGLGMGRGGWEELEEVRPGARWITERAGGQRRSHWPDGCCSFQPMSFWTTGIHPGQAQKKPAGNQRAENLWRRGGILTI